MPRIRLNRAAFIPALEESPLWHRYASETADRIIDLAKETYQRRQVTYNEDRTSETTPPKYMKSFYKKREGINWIAGNEDEAAMWVEFGAHAGGQTPVLKYKPLTTALDILESRVGQE